MMNNYKYGGGIENENAEMVMNNNNQIKHHTEELEKIVTPETEVPAWVVSKVGRSASDLSDATHYLDGVSKIKYADGGSIPNNYDGKAVRHIWNSWSVSQRKHFLLDHNSNEVQDSYGEYRTEYLSEVEIENIAEVNYEDLPQDIKTKVFIHTDMGQYADGGSVGLVKVKQVSLSGGGLYEFELIHNGKKISGDVMEFKFKNLVGETHNFDFMDVKGYDWVYYTESDADYISDKRTSEQKEIEQKILNEILKTKFADGGGVGGQLRLVVGHRYILDRYNELSRGEFVPSDLKQYWNVWLDEIIDNEYVKVSGFLDNKYFKMVVKKSSLLPYKQYKDGGVAYNPVWAEMEAYSPYSSRSEYENKKEYDDLTFASKSFSKSAEILVKENLMNGEICICKLRKILGHEPAYPIQYVGSIKLTKCFLKPFYKI